MREPRFPLWGVVLILVAICSVVPESGIATAWALPEDRDQPLRVRSSLAEQDQATGTIIYTGEVEIVQGSLRITADRVVVTTADDDVTEIVATGTPATIEQKPAPEEEIVHGLAETIRYDVAGEILTLSGKASIRQGDSTVEADRLEYYPGEKRYEAHGAQRTAEGVDQRVRVEIPARRLSKELEKQ